MQENKNRDDKYINKEEDYEIDYIKSQYDKKYHEKIDAEIDKGNYQSHDELYKSLSKKGIKRKKIDF